MKDNEPATIYWHDYETFGANPSRDRPAQFAGIRTDLELNIVGEPDTFYCRLAEDYLPAPEAILITGITPQLVNSKGLLETEFMARRLQFLTV
jgi:exodeoxyribonuclease-1